MKRKKIFVFSLSFIFVILQFIGKRMTQKLVGIDIGGTIYYLAISTFFIYIIIYIAFTYLDNNKILKKSEIRNKYITLFDNHTFLTSFFMMLIFWLPIIIIKYPGNITYDGDGQILEFFGYSKLTDHHPVLHTVLFGLCVELGKRIHSYNLGIFIFTLLQTFSLITAFSCTIKVLKEIGVGIKYRIFLLAMYSLFIIFPISATVNTKDILYTSFAILYTIIFLKFIDIEKEDINLKTIILSVISILLFSIFRKEGIYVSFLSFPILFILNKKSFKKLLIIFVIFMSIYIGYRSTLKILKIPSGSIKEPLAIPFQQTAEYFVQYKDEITEDEKEIISKIFQYDRIENYDYSKKNILAKQYFNSKAKKEDFFNYFKLYIKQFFKHPHSYYVSWANLEYPFFYVGYKGSFFGDYIPEGAFIDDFNFHYIEKFDRIRKNILNLQQQLGKNVLFLKSGFNFCLILFMYSYLLYKKEYKYSCVFIPVILIMILGLMSPKYIYRLAMHFIYQVPLLIGVFIWIINKEKVE